MPTDTNTLKATTDKATYVKGETMTLTLTGDYVRTTPTTVDPGPTTVALGGGDLITSDPPAHAATHVNNLNARFPSPTFTDSTGRTWTTQPDGRTAKATA